MSARIESSDDLRNAKPLKHAKKYTLPAPMMLEQGQTIDKVEIVYETYGILSPKKDNAILIFHALSGDSHVAMHDDTDDPGWWEICVGPGKPIDTEKYFIICANVLGGCRGSTGPKSINPSTNKPYGGDFPPITIGDMVNAQVQLLDYLGIAKVMAVVGASMGGQLVLQYSTAYPDRLIGAAAIATSPRLTHQALAFDVVGRNAILRDPLYNHGQYYDHPTGPNVGLAVARMLAHITYLSPEAMDKKFNRPTVKRDLATEFETRFAVGSYLAYQGSRFVERFDANSYISLTMAMDMFNLGSEPQDLKATLNKAACRWLILSFSSDWLFPSRQSQEMVDALLEDGKSVTYAEIESRCGHDAFLLPDDFDRYGEMIRAFLCNLNGSPIVGAGENPAHRKTSVFHGRRFDYDMIEKLVPNGASVLDLGCGGGGLLSRLKAKGHHRLLGIEIDELAILQCHRKGIDVIRADLNLGLESILTDSFDIVMLSQTLQTVRHVDKLVEDMLRVGKLAIVSFPNVAYAPYRARLAETGQSPRTGPDPWHSTPDIRFLSILDFEEFCNTRNVQIRKKLFLDSATGKEVSDNPNLNADTAIFVLGR